MNRTIKTLSAISLAAASLSAFSASADFRYDLRFADTGLETKELTSAGGTFTLVVYAVVTGNGSSDLLQAAGAGNLAMFSQQYNGGVATGGGIMSALPLELQSGARAGQKTSVLASGAGWTDSLNSAIVSNTGVGAGSAASIAHYSNDGIEDWGSYAPIAGSGSQGNNAANLRYVGDDTEFAAAFGGAGRRAGATTGTANVPVANFVVNFTPAQVAAAPATNAATRYRVEIPYRTSSAHGFQLTWYENQATNSTIFSSSAFNDVGVAPTAPNFSAVRAAYGQQLVQNAFVDFITPGGIAPPAEPPPPPPTQDSLFIDLVRNGAAPTFPDLGDAVAGVVVPLPNASKGYLDIFSSPNIPLTPVTYVSFNLSTNGVLPSNFSIIGGTNVTATPEGASILSHYGSGLDVVFAFSQFEDDVQFDFGSSTTVSSIVVGNVPTAPPPTRFIDLVDDGSAGGNTDLGNATVGTVLDIPNASAGYVDIIASPNLPTFPITYVSLDLFGGTLPSNFSIIGGTNVTATQAGADILNFYGSGLDVVFAFTELGNDVLFDFGTSGVLVDKILVGGVPPPPPELLFIDLVGNGSDVGFPDLGDAQIDTVLDISNASKGYVDITGNLQAPITTFYVALDLVGGSLPANFNIIGGTNVTFTLDGQEFLDSIGSGFDVVFAFTLFENDLKFNFGSVLVDKILVTQVIPEPTAVAALALGGLVALRRRRA